MRFDGAGPEPLYGRVGYRASNSDCRGAGRADQVAAGSALDASDLRAQTSAAQRSFCCFLDLRRERLATLASFRKALASCGMAYVAALHASKNDVEGKSGALELEETVAAEPGAVEDNGPERELAWRLGISKIQPRNGKTTTGSPRFRTLARSKQHAQKTTTVTR